MDSGRSLVHSFNRSIRNSPRRTGRREHRHMQPLVIGIDRGTQSTKALVVEAKSGKVLATGSQGYDLLPKLPPGAKEQHPHTWRDAAAAAIRQAMRAAKASGSEVVAMGVSGQQHGFVALDKTG